MKKKLSAVLLLIILVIVTAFTGCKDKNTSVGADPSSATAPETAVSVQPSTTAEPTTPEITPVTVNLVAVGDMLMHAGASIPAMQADGSYNYDYLFANVRESIASADIAVANNEVIMAGNELGNIGYPQFNVRTELGDAEVSAGFDVILGATNHAMDQNASGIMNCVNYWHSSHPDTALLGIHSSADEASNITVKEVNGIKIAMLNYTYGLNGFEVPQDMSYAVDLMNDSTADKIAGDIAKAKDLADFVIVYPHWGTEYNLGTSDEQNKWAQFFADHDVDLVIGTHPHVVEPVQYVTGSSGHQTLVYYSLGNYVSIQYYNFSMLGGMAQVAITKDSSGTYISSYDMKFLVTHYTPGRTAVTTYFLDNYTDELAAAHAIHTEPPEKYNDINQTYPFTVAGLKSLAEQICPDLADY